MFSPTRLLPPPPLPPTSPRTFPTSSSYFSVTAPDSDTPQPENKTERAPSPKPILKKPSIASSLNSIVTFELSEDEDDDENDQQYEVIVARKSSLTLDTTTALKNLKVKADHAGWLWRKKSIFTKSKYFALIHDSYLYLYADPTKEEDLYIKRFFLANALLESPKGQVISKFGIQVQTVDSRQHIFIHFYSILILVS